jgi:hypothetical protein
MSLMARARAAPVLAHAGMFIPAGGGRAPGTTRALKTVKPAIASAGRARNAASDRGQSGARGHRYGGTR